MTRPPRRGVRERWGVIGGCIAIYVCTVTGYDMAALIGLGSIVLSVAVVEAGETVAAAILGPRPVTPARTLLGRLAARQRDPLVQPGTTLIGGVLYPNFGLAHTVTVEHHPNTDTYVLAFAQHVERPRGQHGTREIAVTVRAEVAARLVGYITTPPYRDEPAGADR